MLVELNTQNIETETNTGLKLVEFYTTWCNYCKNQRIELQEFEKSEMWIGLVDAEECPEFTKKLQVSAFPTFILLKEGKKIAEIVGFHTKAQLLNKLMPYI